MPGRLVVISGPSGVGKSTIVHRLANRLNAVVSVSATTRPPGKKEKEGRDYYFISLDDFRGMIDRDEFLEWAEYLGNCYGTPKEPVEQTLRAGKDVILEIEVEGGKQVVKRMPVAIMIYLLPPDDETLRRRLEGRSREASAEIDKRFANAKREIEQARAAGVYPHWVVNDEVDRAVDEIVNIIQARSS